ncbi:hypothetical protein ABW21_db0208931 [Orbilia brochopaga]|nr:hypothetical protein ABW21_db0208931 [Drechslerella brochopaga]
MLTITKYANLEKRQSSSAELPETEPSSQALSAEKVTKIRAAANPVTEMPLNVDDLEEPVVSTIERQNYILQLAGEVLVEYENETQTKIYKGQLDYCLALMPRSAVYRGGLTIPLLSILAVVKAKHGQNLSTALHQLLVYLAVLHESRKRKSRPDSTAIGVATNGYLWVFYKIDNDGKVSWALYPSYSCDPL